MNNHLRLKIVGMREDLYGYLPRRIVDRIEPSDVILMHNHRIGNDIAPTTITTQEYINLIELYDTRASIVLK